MSDRKTPASRHTLLLRLAGPMQSWGTQSRYSDRDTGLDPSKSGVIGLCCAALGRPRDQSIDDLAGLRLGVRVDREGSLAVDYQTAGGSHRRGDSDSYGVVLANGAAGRTVLSNRYYLMDADFLVGLEGTDAALDLLREIDAALAAPHWPLALGRKAFPPGQPVHLPAGGLRLNRCLLNALRAEPWPTSERCRFVLEDDVGTSREIRHDQPLGAAFATREFLPRGVVTTFLEPAAIPAPREGADE